MNVNMHSIFNEMTSITSMKVVTPMTESQNVPLVRASPHLPVKRMAPCPSSQHFVAVPKRTRLTASSEAHLRQSSYSLAMSSPNMVVAHNYVATPSNISTPNRGLSFVPTNTIRSVNCCAKENLCFGQTSSATGLSTPPYGSQTQNTHFVHSASRRGSLKQLVRKSKKKSPYKNRVSRKVKRQTNIVEEPSQDSLRGQPKALVVYNEFLRQLESENQGKCTTKTLNTTRASAKYSRGFTPSVTSTPQHNASPPLSRESSQTEAATSDYFSAPNSGSASSKTSSADDSFVDFLRYIETGVARNDKLLLLNETRNQRLNEDKSKFSSGVSLSTQNSSKSVRKPLLTSTPQSDQQSDVTNNNRKATALPGMYPIGAPRYASSPITFKQQQMVAAGGRIEYNSAVWRPWC
uniref:uncharacterized protein LOC100187332 n=1 Tax=Ciona intestinalis TaxID=7719 RepID=UPI000052263F|nr:uncharacterized protein LOC100187332 [Ciona intestinalis]|eukprot:XP_002128667.2 uncharacterized protein LOC100187332 [Ciona intestinalis]